MTTTRDWQRAWTEAGYMSTKDYVDLHALLPECCKTTSTADFDPDWPHGHIYNGKSARIIAKDAKGTHPIIALIDFRKYEMVQYFDADGVGSFEHRLTNAPAPKKRIHGWINIYPSTCSGLYDTRERADSRAATAVADRIACIEIDVAEGEGLE